MAGEFCIFTDDNRSYLCLENEEESRTRNAIDHSEEWAGDQDGDSNREVHVCATPKESGRACVTACGASAGFTTTAYPDT